MTTYVKKHDLSYLPQKDWAWRIAKAGHNQKSFADVIGKTAPQLSEWIQGVKMPNTKNIKLVEDALKGMGV
jgi:hypothetical protein